MEYFDVKLVCLCYESKYNLLFSEPYPSSSTFLLLITPEDTAELRKTSVDSCISPFLSTFPVLVNVNQSMSFEVRSFEHASLRVLMLSHVFI